MLPRCMVLCALLLAPSLPSVASTDVFHFGHNIVLVPDQHFHNASCILCSAIVQGRGSGSVRVFAGNVLLDGAVAGRVLVFGGNVSLTSKAQVGGRVVVFGGRYYQESSDGGPARTILPPLVFVPLILLVCLVTGWLVVLTRRMVRGPVAYPPLPRL